MKAKRLFAVISLCILGSLFFVQCATCPFKSYKSEVDASSSASMKAVQTPTEYYELRHYDMASVEKRNAFAKAMGETIAPVLNNAGVKRVGIFIPMVEKTMTEDTENLNLYVLLVHKDLRSAMTLSSRILNDRALWDNAKDILNAPKDDPAYKRVESTLLGSFKEIPTLVAPKMSDSRVYQLRQYESHSIKKGKKKMQMFNEGEIQLFRKVGLQPVFFGEALMGPRIPNLTYMVTFDDIEAKKANWKTFGQHPEWKKMREDPQYKDTVSNITNTILKAAPGSQI